MSHCLDMLPCKVQIINEKKETCLRSVRQMPCFDSSSCWSWNPIIIIIRSHPRSWWRKQKVIHTYKNVRITLTLYDQDDDRDKKYCKAAVKLGRRDSKGFVRKESQSHESSVLVIKSLPRSTFFARRVRFCIYQSFRVSQLKQNHHRVFAQLYLGGVLWVLNRHYKRWQSTIRGIKDRLQASGS